MNAPKLTKILNGKAPYSLSELKQKAKQVEQRLEEVGFSERFLTRYKIVEAALFEMRKHPQFQQVLTDVRYAFQEMHIPFFEACAKPGMKYFQRIYGEACVLSTSLGYLAVHTQEDVSHTTFSPHIERVTKPEIVLAKLVATTFSDPINELFEEKKLTIEKLRWLRGRREVFTREYELGLEQTINLEKAHLSRLQDQQIMRSWLENTNQVYS